MNKLKEIKTFKVKFENNRFYRRVFMNNKRPKECPKTIEVELFEGMPLTYSIGGDDYAYEIVGFETTLKGDLKRVLVASSKGDTPRVLSYNERIMKFKEVGKQYGFYYFGEANNYRDPSF